MGWLKSRCIIFLCWYGCFWVMKERREQWAKHTPGLISLSFPRASCKRPTLHHQGLRTCPSHVPSHGASPLDSGLSALPGSQPDRALSNTISSDKRQTDVASPPHLPLCSPHSYWWTSQAFLDLSCISKARSGFGLRGQQDGCSAEVMLLETSWRLLSEMTTGMQRRPLHMRLYTDTDDCIVPLKGKMNHRETLIPKHVCRHSFYECDVMITFPIVLLLLLLM